MPAVNPKKLKRLMVTKLFVPFAMNRRLSGSQLEDLVHRAMTDKRFDLSASSDEFADYFLDEAEAAGWAEELERSNKAPHLFNTSASETAEPERKFGGHTQEELEKMSSQQVLRIANQVEFEKHAKKKN